MWRSVVYSLLFLFVLFLLSPIDTKPTICRLNFAVLFYLESVSVPVTSGRWVYLRTTKRGPRPCLKSEVPCERTSGILNNKILEYSILLIDVYRICTRSLDLSLIRVWHKTLRRRVKVTAISVITVDNKFLRSHALPQYFSCFFYLINFTMEKDHIPSPFIF